MSGKLPVSEPIASRLPFVLPDFPLIICWSYKAANTTMLKWFLFQNHVLRLGQQYSPDAPHLFWHDHLHKAVAGDYSTFSCTTLETRVKQSIKVLRDPALRAISMFIHFVRNPAYFFDQAWDDFINWKKARGLDAKRSARFTDFLDYVISRKRSGNPVDPHFMIQYHPVQDSHVELFLPLESLGETLPKLERRHSLMASCLSELSASLHHYPFRRVAKHIRAASQMTFHANALERSLVPRPGDFLDYQTLNLIREAYEEDYAAYSKFYPA